MTWQTLKGDDEVNSLLVDRFTVDYKLSNTEIIFVPCTVMTDLLSLHKVHALK